MRKVRCSFCKSYFALELDGRRKFYKTKYCSTECFRNAATKKGLRLRQQQVKRMQEKFAELKNRKGKLKFKCRHCRKEYLCYVSQARARGTSYCSKKCKLEYSKSHRNIPVLKKEAWDIFSKYIRVRDAINTTGDTLGVRCITCSKIKSIPETDAGHFQSRVYTEILFDEHNVHAQCKSCNMPPHSGEQYIYSKRIVDLYGEGELERLTNSRKTKKFERKELVELKSFYKEKLKGLLEGHINPWRMTFY